MAQLIYSEESYMIVGACFTVYKKMGCGFLESVYQECLEIEFEYQKIPFYTQKEIKLTYRDRELKQRYKPDLLCYNKIIVELKAVSKLIDDYRTQILNYLNATGLNLGLLINFGHYPNLEYERFVLTKDRKEFTDLDGS